MLIALSVTKRGRLRLYQSNFFDSREVDHVKDRAAYLGTGGDSGAGGNSGDTILIFMMWV
jgi:hypothetical protein